MDFSFSADQEAIRAAVEKICARFGDDYWLERDRTGAFPQELHGALAADGWLGIAMPEAYGGAGLGITEAALMMQTIAASGAAMSGASAVHMNIFGLNPVVVFGTDEQKRRWLPPLRFWADPTGPKKIPRDRSLWRCLPRLRASAGFMKTRCQTIDFFPKLWGRVARFSITTMTDGWICSC